MSHLNIERSTLSLAVAAIVAASHGAFAQTPPNIGDVLQQLPTPAVQPQAVPALPAIGNRPIEPPLQALPGGPTMEIKAFELVGNREIASGVLMPMVTGDVGKRMSLSELETLAQKITKYYRIQGYFVARAYVPAQEVKDGTIRIRVVEGNYGQFKLHNKSLVRDDIVQGLLDDVKTYDIVSLDTLERAMLNINDTPGVKVTRADVMPGEKVGTSDFAVDTATTPAASGFVMLDNYGSAFTGINRLSFNADWNSPTGRGDRLSVSGLTSDHGGIVNGRAAYSALLSSNGTRAEVSMGRTNYALGSTYAALDAQGTASIADLTLSYPLRRISAQTIETSLNLAYKVLEDRIQSTNTVTPKDSKLVTAAISLRDERNFLGADGLTQANAAVTFGEILFKDAAALATDASAVNTAGTFSKLVLNLSRVGLLPENFTLTTGFKLQQVLKDKNLDGSERMAVSGSGSVMGYPSGELSGSNAALIRLELSRPLPVWMVGLQSSWQVFGNWGQASAAKPVTASDYNSKISDVGLGWTGNYQNGFVKIQLAHRLAGEPSSEPYPANKLLVQAGLLF